LAKFMMAGECAIDLSQIIGAGDIFNTYTFPAGSMANLLNIKVNATFRVDL